MGADDYQVFLFADNFYKSNLNIHDFLLSSDHFYGVFTYRFVWVIFDLFFYKIIPNAIVEIAITLIPTLVCLLNFILTIHFFKKSSLSLPSSILISLAIFFGTCFIAFFSGMYFEPVVIMLFLIFIYYDKFDFGFPSTLIKFFVATVIILIKPFYLAGLFFYLLGEKYSDIKNLKKNLIVLFFSLIPYLIFIYFFHQKSNVGHFVNYFNFEIILINFLNSIFSYGSGLLFTFSLFFMCFFFEISFKSSCIKFIGILVIALFLSGLPMWHGQFPGNRYISPVLIIFIPEIFKIISAATLQQKKILNTFFLLLIMLHLPIIDYKNSSLHEYINNTANTFKSYGVEESNFYFYPYTLPSFNPVVFSSTVLLAKITNKDIVNVGDIKIPTNQIYPGTTLSRLYYVKKNNIKYQNKILEKIKNIPSDVFFYLSNLIYLILIFISLIIYRKLQK